jgi:hypothetical protein
VWLLVCILSACIAFLNSNIGSRASLVTFGDICRSSWQLHFVTEPGSVLASDLAILRLLRLSRIFRLFKLNRYGMSFWFFLFTGNSYCMQHQVIPMSIDCLTYRDLAILRLLRLSRIFRLFNLNRYGNGHIRMCGDGQIRLYHMQHPVTSIGYGVRRLVVGGPEAAPPEPHLPVVQAQPLR